MLTASARDPLKPSTDTTTLRLAALLSASVLLDGSQAQIVADTLE